MVHKILSQLFSSVWFSAAKLTHIFTPLSQPFITRTFSLCKNEKPVLKNQELPTPSLPPSPSPGDHATLCLSVTPDVSQQPFSICFLGQLIPLSIKSSGPRTSLVSYCNMHTFLYIFVIMVFTQISSFLENNAKFSSVNAVFKTHL